MIIPCEASKYFFKKCTTLKLFSKNVSKNECAVWHSGIGRGALEEGSFLSVILWYNCLFAYLSSPLL